MVQGLDRRFNLHFQTAVGLEQHGIGQDGDTRLLLTLGPPIVRIDQCPFCWTRDVIGQRAEDI